MDTRVVSITGDEPVTVDEVKNYLRVTNLKDDDLIGILITQARALCEAYIGRDIVTKQRQVYLYEQVREFWIPFAPINQITAFTIGDSDAVLDIDYKLLGLDNPKVELQTYTIDPIQVDYTTLGLDDSAIKGAVLRMAANLYQTRNDEVENHMEAAQDVTYLLAPFKQFYI